MLPHILFEKLVLHSQLAVLFFILLPLRLLSIPLRLPTPPRSPTPFSPNSAALCLLSSPPLISGTWILTFLFRSPASLLQFYGAVLAAADPEPVSLVCLLLLRSWFQVCCYAQRAGWICWDLASEGVRFAPSIFILARSPDYSFLGGSVILKFSELRKFFISLINYNLVYK